MTDLSSLSNDTLSVVSYGLSRVLKLMFLNTSFELRRLYAPTHLVRLQSKE